MDEKGHVATIEGKGKVQFFVSRAMEGELQVRLRGSTVSTRLTTPRFARAVYTPKGAHGPLVDHVALSACLPLIPADNGMASVHSGLVGIWTFVETVRLQRKDLRVAVASIASALDPAPAPRLPSKLEAHC